MIAVTTRNFGAPIKRNEDARLLSGQALFVDDVELPGMLHAAFLRSNVAHARIRSIDVTAARAREGVVAVYTAEDLGDYWAPGPLLVPPPPIADITFNQRTQVPLAKDKIRHVGEPLAVVLAQSRYLAEDALADVTDFVLGERHLGALVEDNAGDRRRRDQERAGSPVFAEVGGGIDRDDAHARPRRRNVDRTDARVRDIAAQEGRVQHAGKFDIVDEQRLAAQQPCVLVASDRSAEISRGHGDHLRSRSAASCTASTMCW